MTPNLTNIPYEVLSNIIRYVSFEDTINLGRSCKAISVFHYSDPFCRAVLEDKASFSKETVEARITGFYALALRRLAKRREAFADANPYSVSILAYGTSHRYEHGVLCYTVNEQLRILDLHGSADQEYVVNIRLLLINYVMDNSFDSWSVEEPCQQGTFEVLYYKDNIVSCLYKSLDLETAWLIAINLISCNLVLKYRLESVEKLFVRHTDQFLYYGTHTGIGQDGHRRWKLRGYQFNKGMWFENALQLPDTVGSDIAATVSFEIHEGYLYALSSQISFEMEEIDWTSYYHCCRFPLNSPCNDALESTEKNSMWRRQHKEGPIDDRWTTLHLEIDEETGRLTIVEARKEWKFGASRSQRTYYRTALHFLPPEYDDNLSIGASGSMSSNFPQLLPTNDRLTGLLTSCDRPQYREPGQRLPRDEHQGDDDSATTHTFILSKTKIRTYSCSANAFLDVVNDPAADDWQGKQRLRLRVGARKLSRPKLYEEGPRKGQVKDAELYRETGESCPELNEEYTQSTVRMWPPDSSEFQPIYDILNPPEHLGNMEGTADERSVVYSTGGGHGPPAIVFINFDPSIKIRGLQQWKGKGWRLGIGEGPHIDGRAGATKALCTSIHKDAKGKGVLWPDALLLVDDVACASKSQEKTTRPAWMTIETARYLSIGRGFWASH